MPASTTAPALAAMASSTPPAPALASTEALAASSTSTEAPAGGLDEAADEEDLFYVSLHYFGKFHTVDGLVEYKGGMMITFPMERKILQLEMLLSYTQDMYHVERGHCRGNYRYKLHWLRPGKSLSDGLLFILDDSIVENMEHAIPTGSCAEIYAEEVEFCEQPEMELHNTGDEVPMQVCETYSKHKGSKFSLLTVDVVDTDMVDEMFLSDLASQAEKQQRNKLWQATKKKKQDKEAFDDIQNQKSMEATMVEKAKAPDIKGKAVVVCSRPNKLEVRRKPGALKINEPSSQPSSQKMSQLPHCVSNYVPICIKENFLYFSKILVDVSKYLCISEILAQCKLVNIFTFPSWNIIASH